MPNLPDLPQVEAAIIMQTNSFRGQNNLGATRGESALTKAARDYARFLAAAPIFSHEADGRRPADRIKAAGYVACSTAENLALVGRSTGFGTTELATMMVEGWKNSPGHRKNMLLPGVTETGVAVAKAAKSETYYGVQLFGRPASLSYTFRIENHSKVAVVYALGDRSHKLEPRVTVQHTACDAAELTFQARTVEQARQAKPAVGPVKKQGSGDSLLPDEGRPGVTQSVGGVTSAGSRFQARDGQVYVVKGTRASDVTVEARDK